MLHEENNNNKIINNNDINIRELNKTDIKILSKNLNKCGIQGVENSEFAKFINLINNDTIDIKHNKIFDNINNIYINDISELNVNTHTHTHTHTHTNVHIH
eukprot:GHVR01084737.1.p1 GENE.GHVR01084737.1~~GHVR01084737.1.p1  ORF type:complete len:101 (+),score=69.87 GHVR01084737.1:157-459(+)